MNQKGEVTLFSILCLMVLMGLLTLTLVQLRNSYELLQRRTTLFLCARETKGELHRYMKFMGRTNWAIKNIKKAALILALIPGAQAGALKAHKLKKYIIYLQNASLVPYLKKLKELKGKGCPLDPRLLITPFRVGATGYIRDGQDGARLRKTKWTYLFFKKPYLLSMEIDAGKFEAINPRMSYEVTEKGGKLSSLLSSPY